MSGILVGVNYFAGWWEPHPNKWHRYARNAEPQDWRTDYPERVPLLGCLNDQATMDAEIPAAADNSVDFFPILWYFNDPGMEREQNARFLERGITTFMASPQAHRMRFYIEFCNHPPYEVTTDAQWQQCLDTWLEMLAHPSYLRVGERLVFKVHGAQHFINQNNGDIARCREQLESLRNAVRNAGLGEMTMGGGVMAADQINAANPIASLFDFTCTYMDVPDIERREEDYAYEHLADLHRDARHLHCHDAIPYVPYLAAGWCPRPWPDARACFALPTRDQWALELQRMAEDLAAMPNLGFPLPDGTVAPAFTIYAWNEFGEGGIVAPTQGDAHMKLEEIRERFGPH